MLLQSLSLVQQMDGQKRVAGVDLHPCPGTAATSVTQETLSTNFLCFWGDSGAGVKAGLHLVPVPGRSRLSAGGSGQERSCSGSGPQEYISDLI